MEQAIALAVPVFFALIGLELLVGRRRGELGYHLPDSITNLSCGIGQQVLALPARALTFGVYALLFERVAPAHLAADAAATWLLAMVGTDFCYYWFHRASHRVNVLWAGHIVHHQSEEYNLSVALRQSWFLTPLGGFAFYLPLAVLGVPPLVFAVSTTANTLYQFWIHTEAVGRLGPLEAVLNTPSHHRVHHGINPRYIDKNYGGILIVWDRLFGTFAREEEQVVYGTVSPLASWNPLWANVHYYARIAALIASAAHLTDKLWAPVAPPEWRPAALGGPVTIPPVTRATRPKYRPPVPAGLLGYVTLHFALTLLGSTALLALQHRLDAAVVGVAVALAVASVTALGGLLERRRWAFALEVARLAALAAAANWLLWGPAWILGATTLLAATSASWLLRHRPAAPLAPEPAAPEPV